MTRIAHTQARYATQSPYSDPGAYAALLDAVPPSAAAASAVARNLVVHYRGGGVELTPEHEAEIDSRWLDVILATDQSRHPAPLTAPRPVESRVAGCCRDFTLVAVAALRHHGVPARSRVGFADYFTPGYHHDHVVPEYWSGDRWVRFEPELEAAPFDVLDLPTGAAAPFSTAAETWQAIRRGTADPATHGVAPGSPIGGTWLVACYVIIETAHRHGDELLLWDGWGAMTGGPGEDLSPDDDLAVFDRAADLLIRADRGDAAAEDELSAWYRDDPALNPGVQVRSMSPTGTFRTTALRRS